MTRARRCAWVAATALVLAPGCPSADDDDSAVLEPTPEPTPAPATWTVVFDLIAFRCGCHDAVEQASGMYDLTDEDSAWSVLVGVPSFDVPTMNRIEPGDPENSYLVRKIEGRHVEVGGAGNRMPPTGFPLREDDVARIRAWIEAGAARD
jgi:hypothetical protein